MVSDIEIMLGMQVDCGNLPQGRVAAKPSPFWGYENRGEMNFLKCLLN